MCLVENQELRIDPNLRSPQGRSRSGNGLTGHKATKSSNALLIDQVAKLLIKLQHSSSSTAAYRSKITSPSSDDISVRPL